jgi:hypothetical protein
MNYIDTYRKQNNMLNLQAPDLASNQEKLPHAFDPHKKK